MESWNIALLGPSAGGKTILLNQFLTGVVPERFCTPTIQDTWQTVANVDGTPCSLQLTETSGLEEYQILEEHAIRESEAFLFVYNVSSRWIFESVPPFYERMARTTKRTVPRALVAIESGRPRDREVRYDEGVALALAMDCEFFEVSCKGKDNVDAPFHALVQILRGADRLDGRFSHIRAITLPHTIHGPSASLSITSHPSLLSFSTGSLTSQSWTGTVSTADSGDTIWGPGALTGKALIAFGEATLRAVEHLVVRRRLFSIRASLSRRKSGEQADIKSLLEDLLELSRVGLYPAGVRDRALRLLVQFMKEGDLSLLTQCIIKWPTIEIQLFVSTISNYVNSSMVIRVISLRSDTPQVSALLRVFWAVAQADAFVFRAMVELGLLDMTLTICVLSDAPQYRWEAALRICIAGMEDCQRMDPSVSSLFRDHPLYHLWPSWRISPVRDALGDFSMRPDRRDAWRRVDRRLSLLRLQVIRSVLGSSAVWTTENGWPDLVDDLLTFTSDDYGDQNQDSEIRNVHSLAVNLLAQFVQKGERHERFYHVCCGKLGRDPLSLHLQGE